MRTVPRQALSAGPTLSLGVVFCPPWLLSPLSPASWPPLPRERLKPHAIDIRVNIDPVHWFLSRQYLKNASRVLLTRARQGMVIFVPPGAKRDRTRSPGFNEGIYDYLSGMGVAEV